MLAYENYAKKELRRRVFALGLVKVLPQLWKIRPNFVSEVVYGLPKFTCHRSGAGFQSCRGATIGVVGCSSAVYFLFENVNTCIT